MNVLLLSPYPDRLASAMPDDRIITSDDESTADDLDGIDWVVAYGYRHILKKPVLDALPGGFVNLHIAFLPWNRGAHPNYWAWVDGTPSGVTIHLMDEGIDTGPILAQTMLPMSVEWSLRQTYELLRTEVEMLFEETWPVIRDGNAWSFTQPPGGTHHYIRELPTDVDWSQPVGALYKET